MSTDAERFTIGQLAERTGVTSRTIRFWSDAGLVPPSGRSANGYRLYDAEAVARLDLVQTLRDLGLGLEVVRAVLARATTVTQVAAAHVAVLDEQIRLLRLRRAVLKTVATRGNTIEETLLMHKLARLSAQERQQLIDDFVDGVFAGADPGAPGADIARRMRQLPAELPDDPTPEQVDAWIELAELIADPGFRERARTMARAGHQPAPEAGQQPSPGTGQQPSPEPVSNPVPEPVSNPVSRTFRTTSPSRISPARRWPPGSPPVRLRASPSWTTSSPRPPARPRCGSWKPSPTPGSSATGSCSASSTASRPSRLPCPPSSGSSPPCAPAWAPDHGCAGLGA